MKLKINLRSILLVFISTNYLYGQSSSYDGISISASSVNVSAFYYGEPAHVYFTITNQKDSISDYYKPSIGNNAILYLKNLVSSEIRKRDQSGVIICYFSFPREKRINNYPYLPNETIHREIFLNDFGKERLSDAYYSVSMDNKLRCLEIGEYELTMEYRLTPENYITATHRFKILPVPVHEQNALIAYTKALEYNAQASAREFADYSPNHTNSFENFLTKYSDSIYANSAFISMIWDTRSNRIANEQWVTRCKKRLSDYLSYYSSLRNSAIKMNYIKLVPSIMADVHTHNLKTELDRYLENLRNENWELSTMLIGQANLKAPGLINYAKHELDGR